MIPGFLKKGVSGSSPQNNQSSGQKVSSSSEKQPTTNSGPMQQERRRPSVVDFMTKSGQFLTSIQGTLDKQFVQIAEAVHLGGLNENSDLFSNIPVIATKDFEPYLNSVKEQWPEYRDICSSLLRAKDSQISSASEIKDSSNAFREIPQVFFNSDYKQSGFEQHQIFTQPLRITVQNQGKISSGLATYQRKIEEHLVKHLSNVDGLLKSLMSVAAIQSDIGIALDRARSSRVELDKVKRGQLSSGLRILQLRRRKERILKVVHLLDLCDQVSAAKPSVDSLIRVGDFSGATELVQATRALLGAELSKVKMVDRIRVFIDEHGRSIDNVIESEFAELVSHQIFDENAGDASKLISMLSSMSVRNLLIPSLQIKLKEILPKQLRKEMKAVGASAAYLSGSEKMFELLSAKLSRLAELVILIDQHIGIGLDPRERQIQRLSSLRLFEAMAAAGLTRCSQSISAKLNDIPSETASVVSSQVGPGGAESIDPFSVLRVAELRSVQTLVVNWISKLEALYSTTFTRIQLGDEISFLSSVLKSPSQNGFSPDVEGTVATLALQRLLQFQPAALALVDSLLSEEKWDKPTLVSPDILKIVTSIDPTPTAMYGSASDASDSSPSSSVPAPVKQLRVNRQLFLIVPTAIPMIQLMNECLSLALTVPGVAVECLSRMAGFVRTVNSTCRELVLEGQMTVKQKKVINATNLALSSQLAGMLAQLVTVIAKKYCVHYKVENSLVPLDEDIVGTGGQGVLVDDPSYALHELVVQAVMELNDHRMDVFMKLADILISRFDHHLKIWIALPLANANQAPLEGIVKDFTQMYKVLLKSLQAENLKRVFARAFSESGVKFEDKLRELSTSPTIAPSVISELTTKIRVDLLFLYQNLLVGESMGGVKGALNNTFVEMLSVTERLFPVVDKSSPAEAAVEKLKALIRDDSN
jgi:hypothetical protein